MLSTISSPGFTTNYTELDREKGIALDFVIVFGTDSKDRTRLYETFEKLTLHEMFKKVIILCEAKKLKYAILGDGKAGADLNDISKLAKDNNSIKVNNIIIAAHGGNWQIGHSIRLSESSFLTMDVIQKLQVKIDCDNYIVLSCYAGQVMEDLKHSEIKLLEETCIAACSAPDEGSWKIETHNIMMDLIERISVGEKIFMPEFAEYMIESIMQTFAIGWQLQGKLVSQTFSRKNRNIHFEIERYCEYQMMLLNHFIHKILAYKSAENLLKEFKAIYPSIDWNEYESLPIEAKKNILQLQLSKENKDKLQKSSLLTHFLHEDMEILEKLLGQVKFPPELLLYAIDKSFGFSHAEKLVRLVLKYGHNVTHGQTVDSFMTQIDPEYKDTFQGYTPITYALENDNPKVIKVLLDIGVDIYLQDDKGTIPIDQLKSKNYFNYTFFRDPLIRAKNVVQVIVLLQKSSDISIYPAYDRFEDIINKQKNFLKICLLENDSTFYNGNSELPKNKKVYETYYEFIQCTSQIDIQDVFNVAIKNNLKNVVNDLLKLPNIFDKVDNAVKQGNLDLVKAYLYNNVNIELTYNGDTLLMIAVKNGHVEIVNELIKKGAKTNVKNKMGLGLLQVAASFGHLKIFNMLLEAGLKINKNKLDSLFISAVHGGHVDLAKELQKMGADIRRPDKDNKTPLHFAAENGHSNIILAYWDQWKDDINKPDSKGNTALHYAALSGIQFPIMNKMMNEGANILQFNKSGRTPFHLALKKNKPNVIEELSKLNPDIINIPDNSGQSPLSIALEYRNHHVFIYLLKNGANYLANDNSMKHQFMRNINLSNLNLEKINLEDSDLYRGNFQNTNLSYANLTDAELLGADLTGADLTGATLIGVVVGLDALLSTKSLRDIKIDKNYFKHLSATTDKDAKIDNITRFKIKIVNDYKTFIENTNDVSVIANQLERIIQDEVHPLKYRKIGILDYGNTSSYSDVINMGIERLTDLLSQAGVIEQLDRNTKLKILMIAKTDTSSFEADVVRFKDSFFTEKENIGKLPAEKLLDVLVEYGRKRGLEKKS